MEPDPTAGYPPVFLQAVTRVLANEGGYSSDPNDPGGATNFGISHRDYPKLDMANLTRADAIEIYFRDYWNRARYADLPAAIAVKLFDLAVNMGPSRAVRCLQRALRACGARVTEDGALGNATIAGVQRAGDGALLAALRSEAAGSYRELAVAPAGARENKATEFLAGWLNRAYQ